MRARFVPSYYARDLLYKLQQLRQVAKTVEEYCQELQMGMLHCNIEEEEEPAMARFFSGLNREIQDILDYKDYNHITHLFHLACKAKREVQGRHASTKNSISVGKTNSWQPRTTTTPPTCAPMPSQSNMSRANPANSVAKTIQTPTTSASSMASTGRTGDIQCLRCKGYGHVMRECPSKRVMIVKDDVSAHLLVILMKIHLHCLQLTMQVVKNISKNILMLLKQTAMRALLCSMCLVHKWRRRSKISDIHCFEQSVSSKSIHVA